MIERTKRAIFAALLCSVGSMFYSIAAYAVSGTFQGLLVSEGFDPPIPVVVELKESFGIFSGRVRTSPPVIGDGPITSGQKTGNTCIFTSHIGRGVRMRLEGTCLSASLDGNYRIYFPDGRRVNGTFKLSVLKLDKEKQGSREAESGDTSAGSVTLCLKTNSTCLATCPRGTYNEEFACANACTRRLSSCKAQAKRLRDATSPPGS